MFPLLETIKCSDGKLYNLKYHNQRFNNARFILFGINKPQLLQDFIQIPETCITGLYRCRVVYSPEIESIEFIPYVFKKVESLMLVETDDIEYEFKYAKRTKLDFLFAQRNSCDDILIAKKGLITDSYTANSIFFDGKVWYTPKSYLLNGTQRARLLDERKIKEREITVKNLSDFQNAGLINAFWNLKNMPVISMKKVIKEF